MAIRLSRHFRLSKCQAELDFVDVSLSGDMPLFIDPHALSKREDIWSIEASNLVVDFFQQVIDYIRIGEDDKAQALLSYLKEPNDTGLGLSRKKRQGRGVSGQQSLDLFEHLKDSTAARTGFLKDLEDCELLIPGISSDKISDITTNIIRQKLVEYTIDQCELLSIPTQNVPAGRFWDPHRHEWAEEKFADLPIYKGQRLLLVPKAIVRHQMIFDHQQYYNHYVLTFLQAFHLAAATGLVQLLKNGTRRVTKKSLKRQNPLSKEFLYEFSKQHPDIFAKYKHEVPAKRDHEMSNAALEDSAGSAPDLAAELVTKLRAIPAGTAHANAYHDCMVGIIEALFYPSLMYPKKEQLLHEGRKRIDITYSNAARGGFFHWLHSVQHVPCSFIMVECKNYREDAANPELDQLGGRFSVQRGQFGLLVCRTCTDRALFQKRCRDTARDGRGYILLITDSDVEDLMAHKAAGREQDIDQWLDQEFRTLVF